jgi:ribosomal protein L14E/L6E/L27E
MTIAIKKIEIAKKVLEEQDEEILNRLDAILAKNAELSNAELLEKYAKPIKKKFDLEEVMREQGKKRFDVDKIERLSKQANIQEPIEDLLKMLD